VLSLFSSVLKVFIFVGVVLALGQFKVSGVAIGEHFVSGARDLGNAVVNQTRCVITGSKPKLPKVKKWEDVKALWPKRPQQAPTITAERKLDLDVVSDLEDEDLSPADQEAIRRLLE